MDHSAKEQSWNQAFIIVKGTYVGAYAVVTHIIFACVKVLLQTSIFNQVFWWQTIQIFIQT